jgi:hypothetical protein
MRSSSFSKAVPALLLLLFATPARSGLVNPFDAVQFSGAAPATQIVSSTTCTPSTMALTCTSFTGGAVEIGMVVADASNYADVPAQTIVTSVSTSGMTTTITLTMSTGIMPGDTVEFIGQQIND